MSRILNTAVVAIAVLLSGCNGEPTAHVLPPGGLSLTIVSGDQQSAAASSELPQPLKVQASDAQGRLLRGILVAFKVSSGGGSMYVGAAITDNRGVAQDWWTLGQVAGAQTVDVVAVDPETGAKQHFGTFTATALAPARLELGVAGSANFGSLFVGAPSPPRTFTVSNIGDLPSGPVAVSLSGANAGDFAIANNGCLAVLAPAGSCSFQVIMTPGATGLRTATVSAQASPGGTSSIGLSGTGIVPAQLEFTPASISFGTVTVGGSSATQGFIIRNTGGVPAQVTSAALTGVDAGQFAIITNTCPGVLLTSGNSCSVSIQFRPTQSGVKTASIDVTANGAAPASGALSGTGFMPATLQATPTSRDYGSVQVGSNSAPTTFTVQNTGGSASGPIGAFLTGPGAAGFFIVSNFCQAVNLPPGGQCFISVQFEPDIASAHSATLQINASPGGSISIPLSGTGVSGVATLTINPTSRIFTSVVVGQTPTASSFTVQNTGGTSTGTLSENLTGTNAADFSIISSTCDQGTVLDPGEACSIQVRFNPGSAGPKTATLTVGATPGGTVTSQLSGTGILPAQIGATPTTVQFGNVALQSSSSQSVQLINTGGAPTAPIVIGSMNGTNPGDFSVADPNRCHGMILNPGQTCTIVVTFQPAALGTRLALFGVGAAIGGATTISLQGTGTNF